MSNDVVRKLEEFFVKRTDPQGFILSTVPLQRLTHGHV